MTRGLAEMKFLEPIQTTMGGGLVVAAAGDGKALIALGARGANGDPCPHMVFAWCEAHQVWHPERDGCPGCGTASGAANGGEDDAGDGG